MGHDLVVVYHRSHDISHSIWYITVLYVKGDLNRYPSGISRPYLGTTDLDKVIAIDVLDLAVPLER